MAQVYATRKGVSFLRRNWVKILAGIAILYVGYRVSSGLRGIGSFFGGLQTPQLPQINFPEIKLPEIMLNIPSVFTGVGQAAQQAMQMMGMGTPQQIVMQGGTPYVTPATPQLPAGIKIMDTGVMRTGQSFADYQLQQMYAAQGLFPYKRPDGSTIYVTPASAARLDQIYMVPRATVMQYDTPIGPPVMPSPQQTEQLLKMGLAIDMPTKMGMPTMVNQVVEAIRNIERQQGSSTLSTVVTLTGLSRLYPDLTASQLADLKARIEMPSWYTSFDFGTNTGSGLFGSGMEAIKAPVTAASEALRAQSTFQNLYGVQSFNNPNFV
jgi:hypothetical protein